uniref:Uncharacterized protein n=1 Tax=Daphnia galeata TaxID=27404 RepID=A0A8J2WD63_9CRUS|nr:unnamed protein product [Daphnia galeata]
MWDQLHLVKSVKFNTRQRVWDGILNYGSDFPDLEENSLADSFLYFAIIISPGYSPSHLPLLMELYLLL